jgi:hypothetical protein
MDITQEQSEDLCNAIIASDILAYVEEHKSEYLEFVKNEEQE